MNDTNHTNYNSNVQTASISPTQRCNCRKDTNLLVFFLTNAKQFCPKAQQLGHRLAEREFKTNTEQDTQNVV